MTAPPILLPGDSIPCSLLPSSTTPLKLGPGLHLSHQAPTSNSCAIISTTPGLLLTSKKKNLISIPSTSHARYIHRLNDLVIAQIHHSSTDFYHCSLTPHTSHAILPQLSFEGATKKTRPQLRSNDLVYSRVISAGKNQEVELSCVNPSTGKAAPDGLGPLQGGTVFNISTGLAERLMMRKPGEEGGVVVLEELGEKLKGGFEIAVGKNGRVWVDCEGEREGVRGICAVGSCLQKLDEEEGGLTLGQQRKLVERMCKELGLG